jgi:hypothetical protein
VAVVVARLLQKYPGGHWLQSASVKRPMPFEKVPVGHEVGPVVVPVKQYVEIGHLVPKSVARYSGVDVFEPELQ